jgi:hypothetical protein
MPEIDQKCRTALKGLIATRMHESEFPIIKLEVRNVRNVTPFPVQEYLRD